MEKTNMILVLSDFKTPKENVLKTSLELARKRNAEVHLFCAKKAIDIVSIDNQFSAVRNINNAGNSLKKDMQELTQQYSKEYNIPITNSYAFGNVKNEIGRCIARIQPDAIVLGEKKSKAFGFFGDNISNLVQKKYKGEILIAKDS